MTIYGIFWKVRFTNQWKKLSNYMVIGLTRLRRRFSSVWHKGWSYSDNDIERIFEWLFVIVVNYPNHICYLDVVEGNIGLILNRLWRFYATVSLLDWDDSVCFKCLY